MAGLVAEPQARRVVGRGLSEDAEDALSERIARRMRAKLAQRRQLVDMLGLVYRHTITLPVLGGGVLGPAKSADGVDLRWWLWSPSRRVLIDTFRRTPSDAELTTRDTFARAHGIRYAAVMPGHKLTLAALGEWLEKSEGGRSA